MTQKTGMAFGLGVVLLISVYIYAGEKAPPVEKNQVGRYQMAVSGRSLYKMDTTNGKIWVLLSGQAKELIKVFAPLAGEPKWTEVEKLFHEFKKKDEKP